MAGVVLTTRLAIAAGAFLIGLFVDHGFTGTWDHVALLFVAFCATCGWLYTTHVARQNQIEKNTFDLIYSYNRDARYVGLRERVMREFSPYLSINEAKAKALVADFYDSALYAVDSPDRFPVAYHLIQIANFYEQLAIGINAGLLSDSLAREYFKSTVKSFYLTKARYLIREMRAKTVEGQAAGSVSTAYVGLLGLVRRWHPDVAILPDTVVPRNR